MKRIKIEFTTFEEIEDNKDAEKYIKEAFEKEGHTNVTILVEDINFPIPTTIL
jgi:hypothetical protein